MGGGEGGSTKRGREEWVLNGEEAGGDARGLRMYEGWNGVGVRGCVGTCGFELRGGEGDTLDIMFHVKGFV